MTEPIDLDSKRPYKICQALCLQSQDFVMPISGDRIQKPACFNQWVATCPADTPQTKLQCPKCGAQNSFAVEIK